MVLNIENSERLCFEIMSEQHADLLFELDQDPEVMRYINGGTPSTRQEIETKYLPRMQSYTDPEKGWGIWGVRETESHQFIGWVLVRPMHYFDEARNDADLELGWRFKRESWGKGFATEAAIAVMKSLESEGVKQFSALADEKNTASINVMKKLGMEYVKTGMHKDPLGDAVVVYYSRTI
ncbi:MAG: GNAT family N-acetyltransferase [Mariniblastus sp.]